MLQWHRPSHFFVWGQVAEVAEIETLKVSMGRIMERVVSKNGFDAFSA